jgi:hypothetical protein
MQLSDALRYDFTGHPASRYGAGSYTSNTRLRDTTVADATLYYGTQTLSLPAAIGDKQVRAASMFTQLVPSAQTETAMVNQYMAPELLRTVSAGTRDVEIAQQAHTWSRDVTAENRAYNWVLTLLPIPAPGILTISFMAQGNWYTLQDDGAGVISGSDPSFGSGTVDYDTGATVVTLGALPDAGSIILYVWGSPVHFEVRTDTTPTTPRYDFTLANTPIYAASFDASWLQGGVAKTATADASGAITGNATGHIDPVTGEGYLLFATMPDRGSILTLEYDQAVPTEGQPAVVTGSTAVSNDTLAIDAGLSPSSIRLTIPFFNTGQNFSVIGQADGTIKTVPTKLNYNGRQQSLQETVIGAYDALTGVITFIPNSVQLIENQWQIISAGSGDPGAA